LASRPMRHFGQVSYAWYLWHWPLLAFARANDLGTRNLARDLLLALCAYGLAYVSTKWLETPIRAKRLPFFASDLRSLVSGAAVIVLAALSPLALWADARARYGSDFALMRPATLACTEPFINSLLDIKPPCIVHEGPGSEIFLIGDSHANHWSPALARWAEDTDSRVVERSFSSCNIILAFAARDEEAARYGPDCHVFAKRVFGDLKAAAESGHRVGVVASGYWLRSPENEATIARSLDSLDSALTALADLKIDVLLIGPSPIPLYSIPSCVARRGSDACRLPRAVHDRTAKTTLDLLSTIAGRHANARLWDPTGAFCDTEWCYPTKDGTLMFFDGAHISRRAAELAMPALKPELDRLADHSAQNSQ